MVLGTNDYWAAVEGSAWIDQAREGLPPLLHAMNRDGFPCTFASINAVCDEKNERNWDVADHAENYSFLK